MVDVNINGAWDFKRYPIYPFAVSDALAQTSGLTKWFKVTSYRDLKMVSDEALTYISTLDDVEVVLMHLPLYITTNLRHARVTEQATAKLNDLRRDDDKRLVALISDNCYAALRRIASSQSASKNEAQTLSEIDSRYLDGIKIKPQALGHGGVPMPVFHRLHAAGSVLINEDGLVQAVTIGE